MKTAPLLLLFLITGCAGSRWYQPGVSDATERRDEAECKIFAEQHVNSASIINGWWWLADQGHKDELFKNCMIAKGYRWIKESEIPTSHKLGSQPAAPASSSTRPDAKRL